MWFYSFFLGGGVLLRVDSLQGGLAEGNRILTTVSGFLVCSCCMLLLCVVYVCCCGKFLPSIPLALAWFLFSLFSNSECNLHWPLAAPITMDGTRLLDSISSEVRTVVASGQEVWLAEKNGPISIRDVHSTTEICRLQPTSMKGCFIKCFLSVSNAMWCAASDGVIRVFDEASKCVIKEIQSPFAGAEISCMVHYEFMVYTGGSDCRVYQWDAREMKFLRAFEDHQHPLLCLVCQGPLLYAGAEDGAICVWDIDSGKFSHSLNHHTQGVLCMIKTTNALWTGAKDGELKICDTTVYPPKLVKVLTAHQSAVTCMVHLGTKVWTGSLDKSICVWNVANYQLLGCIADHHGYLMQLAPILKVDSWRVWSVANDKTVKIWEVEGFYQTMCELDEPKALRIQEMYEVMQVDVAHANRTILSMGDSMKEKDREVSASRAETGALKSEIEGLQINLAEKSAQLDETMQQVTKLLEEKAELSGEHADAKKSLEDANNCLEHVTAEREVLQSKLSATEADAAELKGKLEEKMASAATLEGELEKQASNLKEFEGKLEQLNSENAELQATLKTQTSNNAELHAKVEQQTTNAAVLEAKLQQQTSNNDELQSKLQQQTSNSAMLEAKLHVLEDKSQADTLQYVERREAEVQSLKSLISHLEDKVASLTRENQQLSDAVNQKLSAEKEIRDLSRSNTELKERIAYLTSTKEDLVKAAGATAEDNRQTEAELRRLSRLNAELEEKVSSLSGKNQDLIDAADDRKQAEVHRLNRLNTELQEKVSYLTAANDHLRETSSQKMFTDMQNLNAVSQQSTQDAQRYLKACSASERLSLSTICLAVELPLTAPLCYLSQGKLTLQPGSPPCWLTKRCCQGSKPLRKAMHWSKPCQNMPGTNRTDQDLHLRPNKCHFWKFGLGPLVNCIFLQRTIFLI